MGLYLYNIIPLGRGRGLSKDDLIWHWGGGSPKIYWSSANSGGSKTPQKGQIYLFTDINYLNPPKINNRNQFCWWKSLFTFPLPLKIKITFWSNHPPSLIYAVIHEQIIQESLNNQHIWVKFLSINNVIFGEGRGGVRLKIN